MTPFLGCLDSSLSSSLPVYIYRFPLTDFLPLISFLFPYCLAAAVCVLCAPIGLKVMNITFMLTGSFVLLLMGLFMVFGSSLLSGCSCRLQWCSRVLSCSRSRSSSRSCIWIVVAQQLMWNECLHTHVRLQWFLLWSLDFPLQFSFEVINDFSWWLF